MKGRNRARASYKAIWHSCEILERRHLFSSFAFNALESYPAEPLKSDGEFSGFSTKMVAAQFSGANAPADIVSSSSAGNIELLVGNGDGSFQAPALIANVGDAVSIASGDFNGDGKPDIAVLSKNSGQYYLNVFLGSAAGTFPTDSVKELTANDPQNASLAVGDFYSGSAKQSIVVGMQYLSSNTNYIISKVEMFTLKS